MDFAARQTMFLLVAIPVFAVVFVLSYYYLKNRRPTGFPPGPPGYPFIGNLNLIFRNKRFHQSLHQLTKTYGEKIFGLQLGILPVIVMSDYEQLKECFIQNADNFCERTTEVPLLNKYNKGIVLCNGEHMKIIRKRTITILRQLGVGKLCLEEKIVGETHHLLQEIEKHGGESFEFNHTFNQAVGNVICGVLFGERQSYDDPEYLEAIKAVNMLVSISGYQNIFFFLPTFTLPLLPLLKPQIGKTFKADQTVRAFVQGKIDAHRETFDEKNIRDFVDVYLESEKNEKKDHASEVYSEEQIFQVIFDLLIGGFETVSSTLLWACYFLIKYPQIQSRCREEIKQTIGNRIPAYTDHKDMPFVEATICEVQRCGAIVPLLFLHQNSVGTEIQGYKIPARTIVIPNIYTIFHNPEHFPNPEQFQPERFLTKDGSLKKPDAFIPFGIGRRACLGENLAKMEVFLFLTSVLQHFELVAADPDNLPNEDDTNFGATNLIKSYSIIAKKL